MEQLKAQSRSLGNAAVRPGLGRLVAAGAAFCAMALIQPSPSGVLASEGVAAGAAHVSQSQARLRYPVAMALADGGKRLLVANQRSGTISIINLPGRRVEAEYQIGLNLSDLVAVPRAKGLFLCTDSSANALKLIEPNAKELKVTAALTVPTFPVSVCCDREGWRCFVASLWSRRLTAVDLPNGNSAPVLKVAKIISLPFAPRLQTLSPDGKSLVIAGAFAGELAVVDVNQLTLTTVKKIPGQNIRGLAWSSDGQQLFVAEQTLDRLAFTNPADVHWGSVVSNVVRLLDRNALVQPGSDLLAKSQLFELGDVGNGGGDPAGVLVENNGTICVALAGIGEIACGNSKTGAFRRIRFGVRPTALAANADGTEFYAADTFGDAIAVIRPSDLTTAPTVLEVSSISLGPQRVLSALERGERLFFDARLAHDKWMSCHSCHSEGHSSDAVSDTLGDGSFGAPKRIPALGGVGDTGPWAWNGSMHDLGEQVRKSLNTTMYSGSVISAEVADLTDYLKSLKPAPPLTAASNAGDHAGIERGRAVFTGHNCARCHTPPTFTSQSTYDVGLRDEVGNRLFNPPSLRGVSQRAAFFHDARARSLRDVFAVYRHPGSTQLSESELTDLLAFLRSV